MSGTSERPNTKGRVDWSKLQSQTREEVNSVAAKERATLHLNAHDRATRLIANVPVPDVRAIRERLGLSQSAFAERFHLRERTVQQWEQGRAMPDQPARVLLRAIERFPDAVAEVAAIVDEDERAFAVSFLRHPE